jgi:uncharacterized protein YbgA (DUF1722 family)
VEEEGRLDDPRLRENFVERVFAYRRLRALFGARWTVGELVRFHTAEKLLLLAHEPSSYSVLGRLVASAKRLPRAEVAARYGELYMRTLHVPATKGKNCNVLLHMAGTVTDRLQIRRERAARDDRRLPHGLVPLVVRSRCWHRAEARRANPGGRVPTAPERAHAAESRLNGGARSLESQHGGRTRAIVPARTMRPCRSLPRRLPEPERRARRIHDDAEPADVRNLGRVPASWLERLRLRRWRRGCRRRTYQHVDARPHQVLHHPPPVPSPTLMSV